MEQPDKTNLNTLSLQPREARLLERIRDLLDALGPMSADRIAARLKEKHILVLSLMDKAKAAGELYCDKMGRFALNPEQCVDDPDEQVHSTESADETSPQNRLAQVRTFLDLCWILRTDTRLSVTVGRGVDAREGGHLVCRIQIDESGIPMVELWDSSQSQDGSEQMTQSFRIWNKKQGAIAVQAVKKRLALL